MITADRCFGGECIIVEVLGVEVLVEVLGGIDQVGEVGEVEEGLSQEGIVEWRSSTAYSLG